MSNRVDSEKDGQVQGGIAVPSRRLFLRRSTALTLAGASAAMLLSESAGTVLAAKAGHAGPKNPEKANFVSIRSHENAHVAFLVNALGGAARPKPTFQNLEQKTFMDFATVAQALENTGVGAYLGAAPAISSSAYLAAAGSIMTIEARHAGYLNTFLNDPITANAANTTTDNPFESPLTAAEVVANAGPFVASLNGGADLTYSTTPSSGNDIVILNFALALEYLEAEFYNVNVPKFYKGE